MLTSIEFQYSCPTLVISSDIDQYTLKNNTSLNDIVFLWRRESWIWENTNEYIANENLEIDSIVTA